MQDTGLACLYMICRFHQIPMEVRQLERQFSPEGKPVALIDLLRAAAQIGLKAKEKKITNLSTVTAVLPAIACDQEGRFFIVAKTKQVEGETLVLVQYLGSAPEYWAEGKLLSICDSKLVLFSALGHHNFISNSFEKFQLSWFLTAIKKYRGLFYEVLIASFFLQLFALATPLFFQVVMDKVLVHKGFTTLDVLAIGFLGIAIFDALLGGIRNYLFSHTTNRIDVELGAKLYRHLMGLPLSWFEHRQTGQTVARVRELETIRNFITGSALTLLIDVLFAGIFIFIMWHYSSRLTLFVLATLPLYLLLGVFITPVLKNRLDEKFKHGAENQAFLVESINGVNAIKSLAVEPQMQRNWEDKLAAYVNASFKAMNLSNVANQIAGFINKFMTLGIVWWGAHLVISGDLSVGQLVAFNMLASRLSSPILKLVQLWQDFQQAGISMKRLGDILNSPVERGIFQKKSLLPDIKGAVEFNNVCFRYSPDTPMLIKELNLSVKSGEVIGVVGRSGSGKSTLVKLLQRLYLPDSGRVLIDGLDINACDPSWLRQQIGVVMQENTLFNRSVRDNISLVNKSWPIERVIQAAKLAGAHDFISELSDGYDTVLEEQGANLSGGQRQRIAIARALICNPKLLIFDEATSALDYESEHVIQMNMKKIAEGRSVFIIAHRLSTVRDCDRIIVMEKGEIIEQGSHQQLLKNNSFYTKLYRYQHGNFRDEALKAHTFMNAK